MMPWPGQGGTSSRLGPTGLGQKLEKGVVWHGEGRRSATWHTADSKVSGRAELVSSFRWPIHGFEEAEVCSATVLAQCMKCYSVSSYGIHPLHCAAPHRHLVVPAFLGTPPSPDALP